MTYQAAEKLVRNRAKQEGRFLKQGRDSMGFAGYTIVNGDTNTIEAGEGFTFDLWDCAHFFGIEIPKVLED